MSARAEAFDRWIRGAFAEINTELEDLYFAQEDRSRVLGVGDPLKAVLRDEGLVHVRGLLAEGNTGDGQQGHAHWRSPHWFSYSSSLKGRSSAQFSSTSMGAG